MNLKKVGEAFMSKSVGTGPLSYKKIFYRTAVSQRLRNTVLWYMLQVVYCVSLFRIHFSPSVLRKLHLVRRPFQSKSQFILIKFNVFAPADSVEFQIGVFSFAYVFLKFLALFFIRALKLSRPICVNEFVRVSVRKLV